ncbi:class I SAM-dependent methyltransferase [Clostridium sp.]|jgi:tRNA (adenine22-N1)-methyltransferase|uniref:tRNA (adenine(22)-N(1))-methyltransferase n=1 Tax=Clostridium sp. TaxID=1506 RepID=UPI002590B2F6|nr:class I SAM-dependent methyltransferase [Clostridium sp.]MDF2502909.1 putative SAM-dependent methyltransferase [Clostridium sp.]
MDISYRLRCIGDMVEKCNCIADIGTDHAYLPIYLVEKGLCKTVIASDINKGPVEKAKRNVAFSHMEDKIQCRLGPGLTTISKNEIDVAIIAGMGGNLIRDIIEESMDIFKKLHYVILQPVQNADVLRRYICESGYKILDEELCKDENKYYEIIKIKYDHKLETLDDDIYYEVSKKLLEKKHPLLKEYICFKIKKYDKIVNSIVNITELAKVRKVQLEKRIMKLKEMLKCL